MPSKQQDLQIMNNYEAAWKALWAAVMHNRDDKIMRLIRYIELEYNVGDIGILDQEMKNAIKETSHAK